MNVLIFKSLAEANSIYDTVSKTGKCMRPFGLIKTPPTFLDFSKFTVFKLRSIKKKFMGTKLEPEKIEDHLTSIIHVTVLESISDSSSDASGICC
ncbi:hypothetical protein DSCA_18750 [Desulfosarcina alkanivorans]|uniref:Uncharacterized protein n=1 Tax=Desulfosarcina alkanivorans TaxID=571177 RepID=A0A5K7YHQ7_9BACT|nr:hypothetical protein DSCA_18750 [Desulfosarcina alkanivorans]